MEYLRQEFVRAYTILTRFSQYPSNVLQTPDGVHVLGDETHRIALEVLDKGGDVIDVLCAKAIDPPFSAAGKQALHDAKSRGESEDAVIES